MDKTQKFKQIITPSYTFNDAKLSLGSAMYDGKLNNEILINAPLKNFNRHGLISGATGTGKTKTLQKLCELLQQHGVSVLAMDIKGDLSGISQPGVMNPRIADRASQLNLTWTPKNIPTEFLTMDGQAGVKLRTTIKSIGSVLFSKILDLNEVQSGVMAMAFKFAEDKNLPIIDFSDIKKVLIYILNDGKEEVKSMYGALSSTTIGTIQRKILEIESQGGAELFGEPKFDVKDLLNGKVNLLRLDTMQDKPLLFSTFMIGLLSDIYRSFPEEGDDMIKPKLVLFIDEAHLIFSNATNELQNMLVSIIKLIRSKGVGIFFITQHPTDVPENILAQLGMKIQHALRAFTPKDRKDIKLIADNFPLTEFYNVEDSLTSLGIGEALFTCLDEKGVPTPLVQLMIAPPETRMDTITDIEKNLIISKSELSYKYNITINKYSADEILNRQILENMQIKKDIIEKKDAEKLASKQSKSSQKNSVGDFVSGFGNDIVRSFTRSAASTIGTKVRRTFWDMIFGKKK